MSSYIRRATAAGLLILSMGLGTGAVASASPEHMGSASPGSGLAGSKPAATAAQVGAGWLGRQFKGDVIKSNGKPDPSSTALAVLAFAAAGVGGTKAEDGITWLEKHFNSYASPGGVDDAGALATLILAAQAVGIDPTAFGGTGTKNDLVARLLASQRTSGPDTGLFGSSDPTYDGAFRQGLSLMALDTQGISNPAGVTWLQNQQCSDGGWESYRSDLTVPCDAPDPTDFAGPDTNSTALAVQGLVAAGGTFPVDPTAFLASSQNSDGGFGYIGAASQSPDPDSTAEVIQALVALGQLDNAEFTQPGSLTPLTALASFQLRCSVPRAQRGAYVFPGDPGPDLLATLQAVPGAAEVAFPLDHRTLAPALPQLKCPAHGRR